MYFLFCWLLGSSRCLSLFLLFGRNQWDKLLLKCFFALNIKLPLRHFDAQFFIIKAYDVWILAVVKSDLFVFKKEIYLLILVFDNFIDKSLEVVLEKLFQRLVSGFLLFDLRANGIDSVNEKWDVEVQRSRQLVLKLPTQLSGNSYEILLSIGLILLHDARLNINSRLRPLKIKEFLPTFFQELVLDRFNQRYRKYSITIDFVTSFY